MKHYLLFTLFLFSTHFSFSQVELPIFFTSEEENKVIKETDSGKYYSASGKIERTVFISEDLKYRLFDKEEKLLVEGTVSNDGDKFLREGKWTEYYSNGKIKNTGYYHRGNPVGNWEKFYDNGSPMTICSYALVEGGTTFYCMTGTYEEFFENGQLKLKGLYKAVLNEKGKDTVWVQDPETGKQIMKVVSINKARPEKFGTWEYFNERGELVKNEEL